MPKEVQTLPGLFRVHVVCDHVLFEIPPEQTEAVVDNNVRSVLVNPTGRARRVLVLAGAPGYEFTFLVKLFVVAER